MHIYSIWHLIRFLICSIYGCLLYLLRFLVQLSEMVVSDIDKKMLEDKRIRRIIKANEGKIRDYIKSTNATTHQLKNYLENKYSVWEQQKQDRPRSISVNSTKTALWPNMHTTIPYR